MATHRGDVSVVFEVPATHESGVDGAPQAQSDDLDPIDDLIPIAERRACLVPDLVGLGFAETHALVAAARGHLAVSVWQTAVGPWGRVLAQQPESGRPLRRGARISVTVAGRPYEQIADVIGLPLAEAIERLVWLGFMPLAEMRHPSRRALSGHVVATRPAAGSSLASGSVVALTVAAPPREAAVLPLLVSAAVPSGEPADA